MPDVPDLIDHGFETAGCREQHDDGSAFGALICANVDPDHTGPHYDPVLDVYWHPDRTKWDSTDG